MLRKAEPKDARSAAELALRLWPDHTLSGLEELFRDLTVQREAAVFLAFEANDPVGFAQCQLRHDYVEGTDSSPVGYLEGIFVAEPYRRRGYARLLLTACEVWARSMGCREFAAIASWTTGKACAST